MTDDQHASRLPATMMALRKLAPGSDQVALQQVPLPEAGAGQVLLQVVGAGVCGTDVHIVDDEYPSTPPVTMGHEVAGRVVRVGAGVDEAWLGVMAAVETYFAACETCEFCRAGRRNLCPDRRSIGSRVDGGFAEFVVLPEANLHRVPPGVSDHAAALSEPLACVCHCLLDPPVVNAGDRVLVVGPGAMGLLAAQVARAQGGTVTVSGLPQDEERLSIARALGLQTVTDAPGDEVADVVIECSGSAGGIAVALKAARRGGRYVAVGIVGKPVPVDIDSVLYKELVVSSGFASTPTSWRRGIALLEAGHVQLEPLVGRVAPLDEWESVLDDLRAGRGTKNVFDPCR